MKRDNTQIFTGKYTQNVSISTLYKVNEYNFTYSKKKKTQGLINITVC